MKDIAKDITDIPLMGVSAFAIPRERWFVCETSPKRLNKKSKEEYSSVPVDYRIPVSMRKKEVTHSQGNYSNPFYRKRVIFEDVEV